jgi:hypothetical protein
MANYTIFFKLRIRPTLPYIKKDSKKKEMMEKVYHQIVNR